jgi:hypothetical protein
MTYITQSFPGQPEHSITIAYIPHLLSVGTIRDGIEDTIVDIRALCTLYVKLDGLNLTECHYLVIRFQFLNGSYRIGRGWSHDFSLSANLFISDFQNISSSQIDN